MGAHAFSRLPQRVPTIQTRYRRIQTALPVPESLPILADLDRLEARSMHGQLPIVWDRAEGFQVHDAWGNTWIDFTSTIFVSNTGHGHERIRAALRAQLDQPLLHSYTFATKIRRDYLRALIEATPPQFEKAFLLSAGTEATECVLKLMRLHGLAAGKRRPGVLTFEGNWHGRTLGAQMLGHNAAQKAWIGYHDPNIFHLPFPYPWRGAAQAQPREYFRQSLSAMLTERGLDPRRDLCGVLFETYQGWGAWFYPPEFVQEAVAFARANNLVIAFDEMQAGFGRTGTLFGYEHYGVEPDLLACGKGVASGFPLALVLGPGRVMDLPETGSMSSTHSANPLACAAGLANLQALLDDGILARAKALGEEFQRGLRDIQARIGEPLRYVSGRGLVAALVFMDADNRPLTALCDRICLEALQRGLLVVHTGRESIKLAPPLVITPEALREGLAVLEEAIRAGLAHARGSASGASETRTSCAGPETAEPAETSAVSQTKASVRRRAKSAASGRARSGKQRT